jgi:cytochrome c-type biogenesis protein CcmH
VKTLALIAAVLALAAPKASLPDIEDEVMCVECGTALNISESTVAERERAFIRRQIALGKDKEQIKDALVAEFGPGVLAVPDDDGFGLAAYLVPIALAAAAGLGVAVAARRWRRRGPQAERPGAELDEEDARRLERELAAYDRR